MSNLPARLAKLEAHVRRRVVPGDTEVGRRLALLTDEELRGLELAHRQGQPGVPPLSEAELAALMEAWDATAAR